MAHARGSGPWRVFLSRTSELEMYPPGASFASAAKEAISRAGHVIVDMAYFAARDSAPAQVCREKVGDSDVYVIVAGFRYGSPVSDDQSLSYTELEFAAASAAGLPRLVFLLSEEAEGPASMFRDVEFGARQESFRRELRKVGVSAMVRTPEELAKELLHALIDLKQRDAPPERAVLSQTTHSRPVYAVPGLRGDEVARDELVEQLVTAVLASDVGTVAVSTGLIGAGGFGKTTLARIVAHDERVRTEFCDGLIWVTVGEETAGPELAALITSVARLFDPQAPELPDPFTAGVAFGQILDDRRVLLVIDDVWTSSQIEPFLEIRNRTVRLFTTRQRGILPANTVVVRVDQMRHDEATALLTIGLPDLDASLVLDTLRVTGRWPMVLAMVRGAIFEAVAAGGDADHELAAVLTALGEEGITALDVDDPDQRQRAVGRTIEVSLHRLSTDERNRYIELAVFGEDMAIPLAAVITYWGHTGAWSEFRSTSFCGRLFDLGLLVEYRRDSNHIQLHDVIRAYLRRQAMSMCLELDVALLDAHRPQVPFRQNRHVWSGLPTGHYLWSSLPMHLAAAQLTDELTALLEDPQWLVGRLRQFGPASLEADLLLGSTAEASALATVIRQNAHVLRPLSPPGALAATLLSRLPREEVHTRMRDRLARALPPNALCILGAPPDLPHPGLHRALAGHSKLVNAVAVAPDGRWLATASSDGTVRFWDPLTGQTRRVLTDNGGEVHTLTVAPDGSWLATGAGGYRSSTLQIRDTATGSIRHQLVGHEGSIRAMAVAPDGSWLASAGDGRDPSVRLWDPTTGRVRHVLTSHTCRINGLAVAPDGSWLASADGNGRTTDTVGSIQIWDPTSGQKIYTLVGHTSSINVLAVSPDGGRLASGDGNSADHGKASTVRLWNPRTGQCVHVLPGHMDRVTALAFAPDGSWLASASTDSTIRLWDPDSGRLLHVLTDHPTRVNALAVAPDGSWIASLGGSSLGGDSSLRIWDPVNGQQSYVFADHNGAPNTVVASPDGEWLAAARGDCTIRIWHLPPRRVESVSDRCATEVSVLAVPTHGRWIISAGGNPFFAGDCSVRIWDPESGHVKRVLDGHGWRTGAIAIASDGSWFASGGSDRTALIRDSETGKTLAALPGHNRRINAIAIDPYGKWLASATGDPHFRDDDTVRIWDIQTWTLTHELVGHGHRVTKLVAARDGTWLASGDVTGTVRIWDPMTGLCLSAHRRQAGGVALAVAPSGTWLAAGTASSSDDNIHVWDPATGRSRSLRADYRSSVSALCFSSDGSWLATAGGWPDATIHIWDTDTGEQLSQMHGHTGAVDALAISPDGSWLASVGGHGDCTLRQWKPLTGEPISAFRAGGPLYHVAIARTALVAAGDNGLYFFKSDGIIEK